MRALALVARLPAHRPREVLRVVPLGGAGGDEQLRHLLRVHVFVDRRIRRRAERIEDEQDFVALHELARLLDRLGRAIAVVIADEVDLAAVDAAGVVDHLEVGGLGLADHAVSGSGTAIRHDVADLDFGIGRAGIVFLLRERAAARSGKQSECGNRCDRNSACENSHDVLPLVQCLMAVSGAAFLIESSW